MDTDSAYIAIAGDSVESLMKPELKAEFEADKCDWFPRTDMPEHKAYNKRIPGIFMVEWEGKKESWVCVPRLITILARKISLVAKGLTRNAMTSTKTSIFKFC